MAIERYNLTFSTQMGGKPILYNIGQNYGVVVNIERANVSEEAGWVQISLQGESEEIQRAIAELNTTGVFVSPVELAVVA